MDLEHVDGSEPREPADLLAAWRGQVRELESSSDASESDAGGELLERLKSIADELARGPALIAPALPESTAAQVEVVNDAIADAAVAAIGDDRAIASPFDLAALTAAVSTLEAAATTVLARAEGEFIGARESIRSEVGTIREALTAELAALREEIQKSQRRASRRSTDVPGPRVLNAANESPVLAKLIDACTQIEALRAQTDRLAEALPTPDADPVLDVVEDIAQLQQFVEASITELRHDIDAFAVSAESRAADERQTAKLSTAAAEQAIAQLQQRVASAASDADQRLARLTAAVQSTVDRAERSASQVDAAFTAIAALRTEATSAVGNWRDEALRIVRDALARMATETAGAANQTRETRKTVIAETRTLRAELLKNAESAHASVLAEVRRELEQTRSAFAEQRQQLENELAALSTTRRQHADLAAASREDVAQAIAIAESTTRQQVERLDAAFRDLRLHLDEVRAANARVIDAVESVEARAGAELAPIAEARQRTEALSAALRTEIEETLAELLEAREDLARAHRSTLDSIGETHHALTADIRRELNAAYGDLRAQLDDIGVANERVLATIEAIEARAGSELGPLAQVRQHAEELSHSLRAEIGETVAVWREARARLEDEHRSALESVAETHAAASADIHRVLDAARREFQSRGDQLSAEQERLRAAIASVDEYAARFADAHEQFGLTREQLDATRQELAACRAELEAAERRFASATERVDESNDHLASVADAVSARIQNELAALAAARATHETSVERVETELRTALDDARAQYETTAAALAQEFRAIAEQRRAEFGRMFDDMRAQFGAALSAIAASNAEARTEVNAQLGAVSRELRGVVERQVQAAAHDIRAEVGGIIETLQSELGRAAAAERDAAALRDAAEARQTEDDRAALERAVGMLSVLETLDDALQALRHDPGEDARERIAAFEREARAMARLVELEEIATTGGLDEDRHEIVGVASVGEPERIVEVRQRGYAFRGRVIRRAQVVVCGAGAQSPRADAAPELTL